MSDPLAADQNLETRPVPTEPTDDMLRAGHAAMFEDVKYSRAADIVKRGYKAMLSAAPPSSSPAVPQEGGTPRPMLVPRLIEDAEWNRTPPGYQYAKESNETADLELEAAAHIQKLEQALIPFAKFACDTPHLGEPVCNNCIARAALSQSQAPTGGEG